MEHIMMDDDKMFFEERDHLLVSYKDNIRMLGEDFLSGTISEGMFRSLWFSLKNDKTIQWPFSRSQECPGQQFFLKSWDEIAIHELTTLQFQHKELKNV